MLLSLPDFSKLLLLIKIRHIRQRMATLLATAWLRVGGRAATVSSEPQYSCLCPPRHSTRMRACLHRSNAISAHAPTHSKFLQFIYRVISSTHQLLTTNLVKVQSLPRIAEVVGIHGLQCTDELFPIGHAPQRKFGPHGCSCRREMGRKGE